MGKIYRLYKCNKFKKTKTKKRLKIKNQGQFPVHENLIYPWDSAVWTAPLSTEDAIRITHAIILRAVEDETAVGMGNLNMDITQRNAHERYIRGYNLRYDCDMSGIDYSAVINFIRMHRLTRGGMNV